MRGKHRARAQKKHRERTASEIAAAQSNLQEERARSEQAEAEVLALGSAIERLEEARAAAEKVCRPEVDELKAEIADLLVELGTVVTIPLTHSMKVAGSRFLFGPKATVEQAEWLHNEATRRMRERWPEEYSDLADQWVVDTVSKQAVRRIGLDAARRIEKARRGKGKGFAQGDKVLDV